MYLKAPKKCEEMQKKVQKSTHFSLFFTRFLLPFACSVLPGPPKPPTSTPENAQYETIKMKNEPNSRFEHQASRIEHRKNAKRTQFHSPPVIPAKAGIHDDIFRYEINMQNEPNSNTERRATKTCKTNPICKGTSISTYTTKT
jgi:hypothetical protein